MSSICYFNQAQLESSCTLPSKFNRTRSFTLCPWLIYQYVSVSLCSGLAWSKQSLYSCIVKMAKLWSTYHIFVGRSFPGVQVSDHKVCRMKLSWTLELFTNLDINRFKIRKSNAVTNFCDYVVVLAAIITLNQPIKNN